MPVIQIQRLRVLKGADLITYVQTFNVGSNREYLDALESVEMDMPEGEVSRTVGEGSPLFIGSYYPPIAYSLP